MNFPLPRVATTSPPLRVAGIVLLLVFAASLALPPSAAAQGPAMQRLQRLLDEVERGLGFVGKKAEELIGPGLRIGEEPAAAYTATRPYEERFPVGPTPTVYISNEFGLINVATWEERVVQVQATIRVGAENATIAEEVASLFRIGATASGELVEIRNLPPEKRDSAKYLNITVDYTVTVPANANVVCDNFFGDTAIRGVGGAVAAEAQYGALELTELRGTVKARMRGEFPMKAFGLHQGGQFQLHGAQAEFSNVRGDLQISNFRGSIAVRDIGREATLDIDSDSGPVHLLLRQDSLPELTATVLFGNVESPLDVTRVIQGKKLVVRMAHPESRQRILVSASFGDIFLDLESAPGEAQRRARQSEELFAADPEELVEEALPGTYLTIDAAIGDVRVESTDEEVVRVQARRLVWAPTAARAPQALRALRVGAQRAGAQLTVQSQASEELAALGIVDYKIDLTVKVPRNIPLTIRAQQGITTVTGLAAPVNITQAKGEVLVDRCENEVDVSVQEGNIQVRDCVGPVEVVGRYGNVHLARIMGKIVSDNTRGNTIVEGARGPVLLRNSGGDVRILALEGIYGDHDVSVRQGELRMLLPEESNLELVARTRNGNVYSARPLTGNIHGDTREYTTRTLDGLHHVVLEAVSGDIIID